MAQQRTKHSELSLDMQLSRCLPYRRRRWFTATLGIGVVLHVCSETPHQAATAFMMNTQVRANRPSSLRTLFLETRFESASNKNVATSGPSFLSGMEPNLTQLEKSVMSVAGTVFTLGILYTLAMNGEEVAAGPAAGTLESLELASLNIVDAALPLTATDIVSVAAGEAIAGLIGAAASFGIARSMPPMGAEGATSTTTGVNANADARTSAADPSKSATAAGNTFVGVKVSDAVADGDFLLTTAAAKQLLGVVGLSPFLATLAATALAIVPYSALKVGARQRERAQEEAALMDQLLADELTRQRRTRIGFGPILRVNNRPDAISLRTRPQSAAVSVVDLNRLTPVLEDKPKIDWVETIVDIVKWLAFDVLRSDFGGHLMWNGALLFPGLESGLIGCVTGLTIQVYADVLHAYFGLGGEAMRKAVQLRSVRETAAAYLSKIIYCAVLFGVYDTVQIPVKGVLAAISSGGMDACVGSSEYAYCIDAYMAFNPSPSPEAELRSLATAAVSLWNNYGTPSFSVPL